MLTLDDEAAAALEAMAAGRKKQGAVVSILVLAERSRREERARIRQAMLDALAAPVEVGSE
jgi:hypothetical protein